MTSTVISTQPPLAARLGAAWHATSVRARCGGVAAAAVSVLVAFGASAPPTVRLALAGCGVLFVAAALIDVVEHRIPNALNAIALTVVALGVLVSRDGATIIGALVGLLVAGGSMLVVRVARGVGMGDVKMAGIVGFGCGAVAPIAAPLAVGVAALLAAAFGLVTGRQRLALAPALWAGWLIALVTVAWLVPA